MRKAAQAVFPGLYDNCGYDLVKKKLEGEDKAALALALPLLEKAREVRRGARRRSGRAPVLKLKTGRALVLKLKTGSAPVLKLKTGSAPVLKLKTAVRQS